MEHENCAACGFEGSQYSDKEMAAVRELGPSWKSLLGDAGTDLRVRQGPGVWSAMSMRRTAGTSQLYMPSGCSRL